MKKKQSALLAVLFLFALFAGCNNRTDKASEPSETAALTAQASGEPSAPAETEDNSPYNFAAGNYEVNEKGYPTAPYDYELPISTTDEVFTYWTSVLNPEYIPEEGYGTMEYPTGLHDLTGVNIEYVIVAYAAIKEQYATLLAADDFCDMMTSAVFYQPGTFEQAIDDGYWVNINDYKDYCPNYIYQATFDPADDAIYSAVFYKKDIIPAFYALFTEGFVQNGPMARGDWLNEVGLNKDDTVTFDDLHNMLTLFKTQIDGCDYPWPMWSSLNIANWLAAYDTLPTIPTTALGTMTTYVIDGKVYFGNSTDKDKACMELVNQWFNEGLINPSWASNDGEANKQLLLNNQAGYYFLTPSEITDYETNTLNDPDVSWVALKKPLKTPDQTVHMGHDVSRLSFGAVTVTTKCENIPLAVSWLDFGYSPTGSKYLSWGPKDLLFTEDENGKMMATEFALNHPAGFSYACILYAFNSLLDAGVQDNTRKFAYPGGEELYDIYQYWKDYNYDGAYRWPVGVKFTTEETEAITQYEPDIVTYLAENVSLFVDGSKPLSEWDAYVQGLMDLGLTEVIAIYQEAYDAYIAERGA